MSSKGGKTTIKRIALSKARHVSRKENTWAIRPRPGRHDLDSVVPLGAILRDVLAIASNAKEARQILRSNAVAINNRVRTDPKFAVGLFDVVAIETAKKQYRMVLDPKGRLIAIEIPKSDAQKTIEKVVQKRVGKKGVFLLTTNAGSVFTFKDSKISVGDSLVIDLEKHAQTAVLRLEKGHRAYVTGGTHCASVATIVGISPSTMQKQGLVQLKGKAEFQTITQNIVVVGDKTAVIEVEHKK
ncbi:MAG: S4 domain-containing protein [Candidatus Diapherotrites archaeon]|nr:S4 domain-containing protein [Candidatus Diapherotrites archaeon]